LKKKGKRGGGGQLKKKKSNGRAFDGNQKGFGCHSLVVTKKILITIKLWLLTPFWLPSNSI
jgi:hypothetical protein